MFQKFIKSSADSTPVDLPPPPTADQMFLDLVKIRPNDPLLLIAPFDSFLADIGEKPISDGTPPHRDETFRKLSKLSSLCDQIRDAGEFLGEKRSELASLTRSAIKKREELEGIVSWTTPDTSTESGEDEAEGAKGNKE